MDDTVLKLSLWFNSKKSTMKERLERKCRNSGVGIHVGQHGAFLSNLPDCILLHFDDGTFGKALVKKNSWGKCTHIIHSSIGQWARKNGLWEKKLSERTVPCYITITEHHFFVSSDYPQ